MECLQKPADRTVCVPSQLEHHSREDGTDSGEGTVHVELSLLGCGRLKTMSPKSLKGREEWRL